MKLMDNSRIKEVSTSGRLDTYLFILTKYNELYNTTFFCLQSYNVPW